MKYAESTLMLQSILDKLIMDHNVDTELRADIDGYQVAMFDYETQEMLASFSGEDEKELIVNMALGNFIGRRRLSW